MTGVVEVMAEMTTAEWVLSIAVLLQYVVLVCSALFLRSFLPAYVTRKGENLATKEDVEEITHKVERAKIEYAQSLERLKADLTDRLVMVEKRRAIYSEIARSMGIFLAGRKTSDEDRQKFLEAYAEGWLWANDPVLRALNELLDANVLWLKDPTAQAQNAMKQAYAECTLQMRRDSGFSETDLGSSDYRFVSFFGYSGVG